MFKPTVKLGYNDHGYKEQNLMVLRQSAEPQQCALKLARFMFCTNTNKQDNTENFQQVLILDQFGNLVLSKINLYKIVIMYPVF